MYQLRTHEASHAVDLVKDAQSVREDYGAATLPDTVLMAGVKSNEHAARSLRTKFTMPIAFDWVSLPLLDKRKVVQQVSWPFLPPHKILLHLHKEGVSHSMLAGEESLIEFWKEVEKTELGSLVMKGVDFHSGTVYAVRLHGDDGETYKDKSLTFLSFAGIAAREDRFCITCIPKWRHVVIDGQNLTLHQVGSYLKYAFEQLRVGTMTDLDFDQIPRRDAGLQLGFKAVLISFQGDLSFFREFFNFEANYLKTKCCHACSATTLASSFPYWDFSQSAAWRQTMLREASGGSRNEFVCLTGFNLWVVSGDILHLVYLGFGEDLAGSAALHCIRQNSMDASAIEAWHGQWASWSYANGFGYIRSQSSCFLHPAAKNLRFYPHCSTAKGWDLKVLLYWLTTQQHLFVDPELFSALWFLCRFLRICDEAQITMTSSERRLAREAGEAFLVIWVKKALQTVIAGSENDYKIRMKLHAFAHVLEQLRFSCINPRLGATFGAESFVGQMCKTAAATHPRTCGERTLERWLVKFQLDIKKAKG